MCWKSPITAKASSSRDATVAGLQLGGWADSQALNGKGTASLSFAVIGFGVGGIKLKCDKFARLSGWILPHGGRFNPKTRLLGVFLGYPLWIMGVPPWLKKTAIIARICPISVVINISIPPAPLKPPFVLVYNKAE
jgi:hypothetical protein